MGGKSDLSVEAIQSILFLPVLGAGGTHRTSGEQIAPGSTEALGTLVLLHCALPPFQPSGPGVQRKKEEKPLPTPLPIPGCSTLVPLSLRGRSPGTCASVPAQDSLSPGDSGLGVTGQRAGKHLPGAPRSPAAGGKRRAGGAGGSR